MTRTLYNLYKEYVVDLDPIMWEAGRVNGVHVDNVARLELLSEMDHKLLTMQEQVQPYVPAHLFPTVHKIEPPTATFLEKNSVREVRVVDVPNPHVKTCSVCGAQHITKTEHTGRKGGRNEVPLNPCYKAPVVLQPGLDTEYDAILPFNPGSDDQLRDYARHFRHKLGRNWHTGQDTLDERQVQKFINRYGEQHPIYQVALGVRKVRKARGYAKAWIPDENGLIYGQFKNVPETLRFSQSDHNLMNVSHKGNILYAQELRRLLVAPPGHVLVEADSASIEAVFSGYSMSSTSFMTIARQGLHAWWALKSLGMEATPENIKWVKNAPEHQVLYDTKKRVAYLALYQGGAKLVHELYPERFPAVWVTDSVTGRRRLCETCTAQAEIDELYALVPEIKQWHMDTMKWAHKHGYLESPWGFRNYYYRVFSFDWKTKVWKASEDAKASIAFQPQHANAMFQRENLKLIHANIKKMGKQEKWKMTAIGHVHDSNGLRIPEDDQEKAAIMIAEVMARPIKQMGNIQVGVSVKVGKNWGKMEPTLIV